MSKTNHIEKVVKAKKVRRGDSIPALDWAFCADDADPDVRIAIDGVGMTGTDSVLLTLHDAQGDEFYLYCWKNMPIAISREVPQ